MVWVVAAACGRTKMACTGVLVPLPAVTTGVVLHASPELSVMLVTEIPLPGEGCMVIPMISAFPDRVGLGSVNLKSFLGVEELRSVVPEVTSLLFEDRCCTTDGARGATPPALMAMVVLRASLRPRALATMVTTQSPAAAAVKVVEAEAGAEKLPHPTGEAAHANAIASPSGSVAPAESES